jgi:hypothetical protein
VAPEKFVFPVFRVLTAQKGGHITRPSLMRTATRRRNEAEFTKGQRCCRVTGESLLFANSGSYRFH